MRKRRIFYFTSMTVLAFLPWAAFFTPYSETALALIAMIGFAVLSFPLGVVGWVIGFWFQLSGIATPAEMTFIMAPIFAALGYIQWARILPAYYRRQGEIT